MGQVSTEQTVRIIEAVGDAMPDPAIQAEPNMSYWWLLSLAVVPVLLTYWLNKRRK